MKSELFDIQNALNACRSSLGKLELTSDNVEAEPDEEEDDKLSTSTSNSSLNIATNKRGSNERASSPILLNFVSGQNLLANNLSKSIKSKKKSKLNRLVSFSKHSRKSHKKEETSSSSLSLASTTTTSGYPSTSAYNLMPKSPPQYAKRYSKQLNKTLKSICHHQSSDKTIVSSSKSRRLLFEPKTMPSRGAHQFYATPISTKIAYHQKRQHSNYNYAIAASSRFKFAKPAAATISGGKVSNIVRVYNHYHKRGGAHNKSSKNYSRVHIENYRSNHSKLNLFKLHASQSRIENTIEKSVIKYKPLKTNTNMSTQFYTRLEENHSFDDDDDENDSGQNRVEQKLKDHFLVINHKSDQLNQSIFEPQLSSTPILKEPKTSTPNLMRNSYFEKIIFDLANKKKRINIRGNLAQLSGDTNKHSDYFSSSTRDEAGSLEREDESSYSIPGPRAKENDYQVPNVATGGNIIECYQEQQQQQQMSSKNPFLFFKLPTTTSTPKLKRDIFGKKKSAPKDRKSVV